MTDQNNSPTPRTSRDEFIDRHGPQLGDSLFKMALDAQRKQAECIRDLQSRLVDLNAFIATRRRGNEQALIPFDKRVEDCRAALQRALDDRARASGDQESLVPYLNAAAELIKEIHAPEPTIFRGNWARPSWFVEDPILPDMPDIRKPRR